MFVIMTTFCVIIIGINASLVLRVLRHSDAFSILWLKLLHILAKLPWLAWISFRVILTMMDAGSEELTPVMKALKFGTLDDQKRLLETNTHADPDRTFFTCCEPVGKVLSKPTARDLKNYFEFLSILAKEKASGLNCAQIRSGLLELDAQNKHNLTKSPNAMFRFSWAKGESEKGSYIWQFSLRGIKREGVSNIDEINMLKQIWYPRVIIFRVQAEANFLQISNLL